MKTNFIYLIFKFYKDGFAKMKLGKSLWLVILIKLIIMFGVLKLFVFNENLNTKFPSSTDKSTFVIDNLIKN